MKHYRQSHRTTQLPITECILEGDGEYVAIRRCDSRIEIVLRTADGFPSRSVKLNAGEAARLLEGASEMANQVARGY